MTDGTIACPVDGCEREWPDTYGADGGRLARMEHIYECHRGLRTPAFKAIDRLGRND